MNDPSARGQHSRRASDKPAGVNLWSTAEHAQDYLRRADSIPHRPEGEAAMIEFIPDGRRRILDLGTGAGRLIALVKAARPQAQFVALDFSPTMLTATRELFAGDATVTVVEHDLDRALPQMGKFDAVISSFAIHHLADRRKRTLYEEIFKVLNHGGIFCNLEHVASPTPRLHEQFREAISLVDDPSNKLLDVESQLVWMRQIGFSDVDCHWKWREFALLGGVKP